MNILEEQMALIVRYKREHIPDLLISAKFARIAPPLLEYGMFPKNRRAVRVGLIMRPTNNIGNCIRLANLYEILHFATRNPDFFLNEGEYEGFDINIEKYCRRIRKKETIPYVGMMYVEDGIGPYLGLRIAEKRQRKKYTLVVASQRTL